MSFLFGGNSTAPTRINTMQINQSAQGYAVPVLMGRGRVQQSLVWADGYDSKKVSQSGGKGFGGGKGAYQYTYSADVIAALVDGNGQGIVGIGDAWSGGSWLPLAKGGEQFSITANTQTFTASHPNVVDGGIAIASPYAAPVTDVGAPGAVTLSTNAAGFQRVPVGTVLQSGQYTFDPNTNGYTFSAADAGKTVTASYSYPLATVQKSEVVIIPAGLTVQVGGNVPFQSDEGVVTVTNDATSGTPVAHTVSGSAPATYKFNAADVSKTVRITYQLNNSAAIPAGTSTSLNVQTIDGLPGQAPASLLSNNYPGAALGYSGIALACYFPMDLGYSAQIQQNTFEVFTHDRWGGGILDCSPVTCMLAVLTNPAWGLGGGARPFPTAAIDNGAGGTWGTPGVTVAAVQDSTATSWFAANGFFISPLMDKQATAASTMGKWLEAGFCAAFMSEGKLKLVPYGDKSVAGNGRVWQAPSTVAAVLDDSVFIPQKGKDPVTVSTTPWQDAYNVAQVSWKNPANQYSDEVTQHGDQAAINRYGKRIEDPQQYPFIMTLPAALFSASLRVKRMVYTRNTYKFSLPFRFGYLEPMDVVTVTSASSFNPYNPLGLVGVLVRLTKTTDNTDGTWSYEGEDYRYGLSSAALVNKATSAAAAAPNVYADPGDTAAVIFEASNRLTGYKGNEIWIGAAGSSPSWGGCNVLVSTDGSTYKQVDTIDRPARLGVLAAALPAGSDPDTSSTLAVQLVSNSSPLESATQNDADLGNTLCYVGGEVVSYSACALTGADQYAASGYLRRGQMGTAIAAHATGANFLRLDDAVFVYQYDPTYAGKTVWFKFQSFNVYGQSAQDTSLVTPVQFTIPGQNPGAIDSATGNVIGLGDTSAAFNAQGNVLNLSGYDAAKIITALQDNKIIDMHGNPIPPSNTN